MKHPNNDASVKPPKGFGDLTEALCRQPLRQKGKK